MSISKQGFSIVDLDFISYNQRTDLLSSLSLPSPPSTSYLPSFPLTFSPPFHSSSPTSLFPFFFLHKNFLSLYNRPDPILNHKDEHYNVPEFKVLTES